MKAASIMRRGTALQDLVAPALGLEHPRVRGRARRRQQRRLGYELVELAHDPARADEPLAADPHAGNGRAAVQQRAREHLHQRQQVDAP